MGKKLGVLMLVLALCLGGFAQGALAGTPTTYVVLPQGMSALNVRAGAGTGYGVVTWVYDGDEIDLIKVGTAWTKITVIRNQKTGYIKNQYIDEISDPVPDPQPKGACEAGRVTGGGVNLRKGAGTGYATVAKLASGTRLKLWGDDGNWMFVSTLSGKSGWISKTYIAKTYQAVTSARVNFRKSINGALIKTLPVGTKVTVTEMDGTWSKIKVGASTGWVFSKYLK